MNRFCDMINLVKWVNIQIEIDFFQNLSTSQGIKGWIENKIWILLQLHQIKPEMRMSQNMKSYIRKSLQQMFQFKDVCSVSINCRMVRKITYHITKAKL